MAQIIDGKKIAAQYREKLKIEIEELKQNGITPGLAVVLVGNDSASQVYVRNKIKVCKELGIHSEQYNLPESATIEQLLETIDMLNKKATIHGILPQLPLPAHLDEREVIAAISPTKDVDAFNRQNVGAVMIGDYRFLPCTPAGIMELIHHTGIPVEGKNCVVVGRSNIVGKPMAMLLLHENGTVTICHSRTKDLPAVCRSADILICAIGRAKFFTADMIKPGAVVIDVGMNRDENGKLCGDVDYPACEPVAGYITPVPGGVGPMTIAMLMRNTVTAAQATIIK